MSAHLPIAADPATEACAGCSGHCCVEYDVGVNGFDLVRLARGLGLPWDALVRDVEQPHALFFGFRLDAGPVHHHFQLRRRASGACQFLLELDGGWRRCGVHGLRPGACRAYPLRHDDDDAEGGLVSHAVCPPERLAMYHSARAHFRALLDEDAAEEALWLRVIHRWDQRARAVPPDFALPMAEFVDWLHALYAEVEPLRKSVERGDWQGAAYAIVDEFPLENFRVATADSGLGGNSCV